MTSMAASKCTVQTLTTVASLAATIAQQDNEAFAGVLAMARFGTAKRKRKRKRLAYRAITDAHEKDAVRSQGMAAFNGGPLPLRTVHPSDNLAVAAGAHKRKEHSS